MLGMNKKRSRELRHYAHLMRIHGRPEEQIGFARKVCYYVGLILDPATTSPELAEKKYLEIMREHRARKAEPAIGVSLVSASGLIERLGLQAI